MGSLYRRTMTFCLACNRRRDTLAARQTCESAGHNLEERELPVWYMKWFSGGKPQCMSSGTEKKRLAEEKLKSLEGKIADGADITAAMGKLTFDDAVKDVVNDYTINGKKSLSDLQGRIDNYLTPYFHGQRMRQITPIHVRAYTKARKAAGAANGTINRELAVLKRAFVLAMKGGLLMHRPHIPMLAEAAPKQGFFERDQFESVRKHLPERLRNLATVYHETGWRRREVLKLEWRHVNLKDGSVCLDPGTTKNDDGRTVYFTAELRRALTEQHAEAEKLKAEGIIVRPVFFYLTGKKRGKPIKCFKRSWDNATKKAGCPGRVVHDFRRTVVKNLEQAGVSRSVAMKMTGHRTEAVYRRYAIVSPSDLREAARKLTTAAQTAAHGVTAKTKTRNR